LWSRGHHPGGHGGCPAAGGHRVASCLAAVLRFTPSLISAADSSMDGFTSRRFVNEKSAEVLCGAPSPPALTLSLLPVMN